MVDLFDDCALVGLFVNHFDLKVRFCYFFACKFLNVFDEKSEFVQYRWENLRIFKEIGLDNLTIIRGTNRWNGFIYLFLLFRLILKLLNAFLLILLFRFFIGYDHGNRRFISDLAIDLSINARVRLFAFSLFDSFTILIFKVLEVLKTLLFDFGALFDLFLQFLNSHFEGSLFRQKILIFLVKILVLDR